MNPRNSVARQRKGTPINREPNVNETHGKELTNEQKKQILCNIFPNLPWCDDDDDDNDNNNNNNKDVKETLGKLTNQQKIDLVCTIFPFLPWC